MIFNMSKKHQFTTNLHLNNQELEIIDESKLLGLWITSDLKWNLNTKKIVQGANMRMKLLQTAAKYTSSIGDLKSSDISGPAQSWTVGRERPLQTVWLRSLAARRNAHHLELEQQNRFSDSISLSIVIIKIVVKNTVTES